MTDPLSGRPLPEALTLLLARLLGPAWSAAKVARLSGGASQETLAVEARSEAGETRPLILRRTPAVHDAHAVPIEAEAALMRLAAAAGVPSPHVVHVLEPADGLGRGFLMDRVEGETIPRKILRDAGFAALRPRLAHEVGGLLARLHAIPLASLPPLKTVTGADELAQLRETYARDGQPRPVFDHALRWLTDHAPEEPAPTLVHGDFRMGNVMVDAEGVRAVLDWELAQLGDPMRDLGWLCTGSWRFGRIDKPVGGFGDLADLVRGYEAAGSGPVDLARVTYWEAFGSLRWGVMCLSMLARYDAGDRTIERAMIGRRASETEIDLLRLLAPRR